MTALTHPAPRQQEQFPAMVGPDFFAWRRWAWRSGSCGAGLFSFEVFSQTPEIEPAFETVTEPLRPFASARPRRHYRLVTREHEDLRYALYVDESRIAVSHSAQRLMRFLTWHINRSMVEHTVPGRVVMHAAAARRGGVVVLLPGDQEHGKTTTVAGLLREGYEYLTDEAAAIDPASLELCPFPKALSLDRGSWHLFPTVRPLYLDPGIDQWQVPAESLGGRAAVRPCPPPAVVLFPRYVAGADTVVQPMSKAEAVRDLAQCTFHFTSAARRNLDVAARVAARAHVARLTIGSLEDAVLAVEETVSEVLLKGLTR